MTAASVQLAAPIDRFRFEHGYFPALNPGEKESCEAVDTKWESRQAVSVTQGSSYDAWALAGIARELGVAGRKASRRNGRSARVRCRGRNIES